MNSCSEAVCAYDAQGVHRTGTDVDRESARWMVSEMAARGVAAVLEEFPFSRIEPDRCEVSDGDWTVEGYPLVDSLLPPAGARFRGVLGERPGPGQFALVHTDGHGQVSTIDAFRAQPWEAIIAVVSGAPGGFTLRNAWRYEDPFGPPVVQVPGEAWGRLAVARASRRPITVACGATPSAASALNVVARVPGADPSLPPAVVLTPRSGWWHCAGERGGGVAIWLEVARHVLAARLARSVDFVATTGHELGFWGIKRHCERHSGDAAAAECWIHLGANIGAAGTGTVVRSSDSRLLDAARSARVRLGGTGQEPSWQLPAQPPGGEAQVVASNGGRYLSLVGAGFSLFHSSSDRWPGAIDAEAIATNGALVFEFLVQLEPATARG